MLSSNNRNEQFRKQEPKKQRFTIKKLTVGVASVLIGFTFMGMSVSADTTTGTGDVNNQTESTQSNTDSSQTDTTTLNSSNKSASSMQNTGATVAEQEGQNSTTDNATANQQANATALQTSLVAVPETQATEGQTEEANDSASFLNALRNGNTSTINLTGNVDFTGYTGDMSVKGDYARQVTIALGSHTLNLANKQLNLQYKKNNWDLTFVGDNTATTKGQNDIKYDANTPIKFGKKTNVTFKNVNIDGNGQFGQRGGASANLKLSGNNNITITHKDGNAALLVESAEVTDGTTVINHSDSDKNVQYNSAIMIDSTDNGGNVYVDDGASLTINGLTSNAMGIFFDGSARGTIDNVRTGLIKVGQNAVLNINLKDGNSAAIYADDIDVLKGGIVDITTAQNTTSNGSGTMNGAASSSTGGMGGVHNGTINLGMHGTNVNPTLRIGENASFKVNRTSDKSSSALLSFGTDSLGIGVTSSVLVNGGSLDLQDHANNYGYFFQSGKGPYGNLPHVGLITMWGTSSKSRIDFEAPKYVNFERFGKAVGVSGNQTDGKTGAFLRLESNNVEVDINKTSPNTVTTMRQWDEGATTPSYKWYIMNEHNTNQWGDNASGFVKQGTKVNTVIVHQGVAKFGESNGSAELASDSTGTSTSEYNNATLTNAPEYMNSFLNNFNWWSPQRVSFGSQVIADEYAPDGGTITVDNGHQLTPTDAANAITNKDTLVDDNGTSVVATDNGYTWTNAPDTTTPGTKAGVVKVTYTDGSSDEVPVTVNVLSQADQYDPQGQNIKTDVDTVPSAESGISNTSELPTGTTYTWSTEPDVSKPGTVPGVVKVTYPDKSVDEVPVNVIVGQPTTSTTQTDADKNARYYNYFGYSSSSSIGYFKYFRITSRNYLYLVTNTECLL